MHDVMARVYMCAVLVKDGGICSTLLYKSEHESLGSQMTGKNTLSAMFLYSEQFKF